MAPEVLWVLAGKELREAGRQRWVVGLAGAFAVLALALSLVGRSGLGIVGVTGFARTAGSLLNAVLLVVPLMGLLMGAVSLAGEREHGTLVTLMAQPVTAAEVLTGKFLGAALGLGLAIGAGFGLSGLLIARAAGPDAVGAYAALAALAWLLGVTYLALGFWLSALATRVNPAMGAALLLWLAATFLSDLGLMGTAVVLRLSPGQLLWLSLVNPSQAFRLAALQVLHGDLELLGASGTYAASVLGGGVLWLTIAVLLIWTGLALVAAGAMLRRRGAA